MPVLPENTLILNSENSVLRGFRILTIFNKIGVIICIDEFDYSKDVFSRSYFQLLRKITDDYPNVAVVTTSRRSILDIEKDSGGGSSFYETCLHIYLKPFNDDEVAMQRSLVGELSDEEEELLDNAAGNHQYLNALVLLRYYQSHDMEGSIDESFQDILSYYNRLFQRVLKRDHLDDKVINIYSGFYDAVSQDDLVQTLIVELVLGGTFLRIVITDKSIHAFHVDGMLLFPLLIFLEGRSVLLIAEVTRPTRMRRQFGADVFYQFRHDDLKHFRAEFGRLPPNELTKR